jgi:hypothetical protein
MDVLVLNTLIEGAFHLDFIFRSQTEYSGILLSENTEFLTE